MQAHQLAAETQPALGMRREHTLTIGWVAAESEHVLDPSCLMRRISSRRSSTLQSRQVRCAIGSSPVSSRMRSTTRTVRSSRRLPPAPWVTDTNAGCSGRSAAMVEKRRSAPSSSAGGKNSNEKRGSPRWSSVSMRIGALSFTRFNATSEDERRGHAGLRGAHVSFRGTWTPLRQSLRQPASSRSSLSSCSDQPCSAPANASAGGIGSK